MPVHCCRLYDLNTQADLILDGCSAQVLIADVHTSVTLSQRFTSPGHWLKPASGVYTFGIMADASVCGFEMVRQDGTKIEGVVKEKQEAKREYERAVKAGHTASLGQQETGDVFSITVGNILPSETVTINLRYIQPLMDDEKKDQIKFIFPRTYAQRYGASPTYNSGMGSTACQPFEMNVLVQQAGAIRSISCPSGHPISLELGIPDNLTPPKDTSSSSAHFASVSLRDTTGFLTQDVVLVISAAGLDGPRCFIESHPSPNHESIAMALTFVPKFNVPDVSGGMEYVFLVDRSGSMKGVNMQLVREALIVLLRGLPGVGTTFNIVSFGNNATKLWENSRAYSQVTLEEATNHIDSMEANYGGTEIASALQVVFDSLPKPLLRPVAVFLLTDGSAWDVSTCVENTQSAIATLPRPGNASSFIRVFTVGIGNGASTDTCESIARAGGGMAVYVKQGEALVGKCSRLVRAARTPQVKVEVDWGVSTESNKQRTEIFEDEDFVVVDDEELPTAQTSSSAVETTAAKISLFDADDNTLPELHPIGPPPKPNPTLPPPPCIQQAPLVIPSIFPGTRTQIYAIVHVPARLQDNNTVPVAVKLKGVVTTTNDVVELVVPVSLVVQPPSGLGSGFQESKFKSSAAFLHTFAAKALIRDREQGKHVFPPSISALFEDKVGGHDRDQTKAVYLEKDIIRLGTAYGLASKYTSFVAVDPREQKIISMVGYYQTIGQGSPNHLPGQSHRQLNAFSSSFSSGQTFSKRRTAPSYHASRRLIAPPIAPLMNSLSPPQPPPPPRPAMMMNSAHPTSSKRSVLLSSLGSKITHRVPSEGRDSQLDGNDIPTPTTGSSLITAIARLQQWHGGFLLTVSLLRLLGDALNIRDVNTRQPLALTVDGFKQRLVKHGVNRDVGATLIALVWMERYGGDEALDMREKAREWLNGEVGQDRSEGLKKSILHMLGIEIARN